MNTASAIMMALKPKHLKKVFNSGGEMKEKTLQVLKTGPLSINVCTDATGKEEIERLTNRASLCGTTGGWQLDEAESKKLGQPKIKCANDPKRTHYILYA